MSKLDFVIAKIDEVNQQDPNQESFEGSAYPKELLYAKRMTGWLQKIAPNASEALQIAVRAQHISRWSIPRSDYEKGKKGYHQWRTELMHFHAKKTSGILESEGYNQSFIDEVTGYITKKNIRSDANAQLLEDVVCLVFLEYYFLDFAEKHTEEKLIDIVKKTWKKMSPKGQDEALKLHFTESALHIIKKAIG